eukprot:78840-Prymnesium_polylepis.2
MHHNRNDLVNVRPCADTITGLAETVKCKWIGDLPFAAQDQNGKTRSLVIRRVHRGGSQRHPDIGATTVDAAALWDCRFGKSNTVHVVQSDD